MLRVEEDGKLTLNDKTITNEALWEYVYIEKIFSFPERDVVIVSGDNGGTRPVNGYAFILIDNDGKSKVIADADFYSDDGTFKVKRSRNIIEVDLGYSEHKRKLLRLQGEELFVMKEQVNEMPSLSVRECDSFFMFLQRCASGALPPVPLTDRECLELDDVELGYTLWGKPYEV